MTIQAAEKKRREEEEVLNSFLFKPNKLCCFLT